MPPINGLKMGLKEPHLKDWLYSKTFLRCTITEGYFTIYNKHENNLFTKITYL